jgi:xanthine dehydrogenase accessory factor
MHNKILDKINNELTKGNKVAFAMLTQVKGSSPGKAGATLAYFNDKSIMGTVGGGILEHEVISKCEDCLEAGQDSLFTHSLNENSKDTPMQCEGSVSGYIKIFKPKPRLLIVGGGHVGFNIYNVSRSLEFYTIVVDDREEFGNKKRFELADEVYFGNISKILKKLRIDENTYVVISTREYEQDLEALRQIIKENPSYIGMIGSSKKWETLKTQLIKEGIKEDKLNNVYAPVGLNISSNEVNEIAFGIMAELLLVKNKGHLSHRKDKHLRIDK